MSASRVPSGIRQKASGSWEYRHAWSAADVYALAEKYRDRLPHLPPSFWKPGQWTEITTNSLPNAIRARTKIRAMIAVGDYVPQKVQRELAKLAAEAAKQEERSTSMTLGALANEYIEFLRAHLAPSSIRKYVSQINQGMADLHELPLRQITADRVEEWFTDLLASRGDYARGVYATLNLLMNYALGQDHRQHRTFTPYITENPCVLYVKGKTKTKRKKKRRALTLDEVSALAEGMPADRSIAVWLGALGGLRQGEILGLQRKHVAIDGEHVWVSIEQQLKRQEYGPAILASPKTEAGRRRIPLLSMEGLDTVQLFTTWLDEMVAPADDAFIVPRTPGKPAGIAHTTFGKGINKAREHASAKLGTHLAEVGSHDLRHTALTNLGRRGATLAELMKFAGHTDVAAVMIYQHSDSDSLARLAGSTQRR